VRRLIGEKVSIKKVNRGRDFRIIQKQDKEYEVDIWGWNNRFFLRMLLKDGT